MRCVARGGPRAVARRGAGGIMLTLGSDFDTPAHRWPVGPKLIAVALGTALIFPLGDLRIMGAALLGLAGLHLAMGRGFALQAARRLLGLWPFFAILALWHLWERDLARGALLAGRMVFAVGLANFVTMTTRLDAMLAVIERALAPLARLGLPPRAVALAMALVIRFTPVLLDKASLLMQAWRARSPRRVGAPVVLPLVLAALDDADHVAEALRARGGL